MRLPTYTQNSGCWEKDTLITILNVIPVALLNRTLHFVLNVNMLNNGIEPLVICEPLFVNE